MTIATDRQVYRRDEPIHVTVRNDLGTVVYVQPTQAPCVAARQIQLFHASATPGTEGGPDGTDPSTLPDGPHPPPLRDPETKPTPRQAVSLAVDKTRYRHGERIAVTIVNQLAATIFAPPPGTGLCSVVGLERSETGTWTPAGTCPTEARAQVITLGPRTVMTAVLTSTASRGGPRDLTSRPVPPSQSPAFSRPVPPSPRQHADLTPQYPEGIVNVEGLLYPSVTGPLLPGIYRIVLTYTVGVPPGPIEQTRSPPFEVTR